MQNSVLGDVIPCSLVVVHQCFTGPCCLHLYPSTLKTEAAGFSKMMINLSKTTQYHIPESVANIVQVHSRPIKPTQGLWQDTAGGRHKNQKHPDHENEVKCATFANYVKDNVFSDIIHSRSTRIHNKNTRKYYHETIKQIQRE